VPRHARSYGQGSFTTDPDHMLQAKQLVAWATAQLGKGPWAQCVTHHRGHVETKKAFRVSLSQLPGFIKAVQAV
jgi:hypothetical protein